MASQVHSTPSPKRVQVGAGEAGPAVTGESPVPMSLVVDSLSRYGGDVEMVPAWWAPADLIFVSSAQSLGVEEIARFV